MGRRRSLGRKLRIKLKRESLFSIAYIILFSLAFIIALSFTRKGVVLYNLNLLLLGYFGWGTIFLVFFFLLSGLMLTKFKAPWNEASVLSGGALMAVSLMGISKAGLSGKEIFDQIAYLLTPLGTYVILAACSAIGFVVFFNTSFDQFFLGVYNFLRFLKEKFFAGKKNKKEIQFLREKPEVKGGISRAESLQATVREPVRTTAVKESLSFATLPGNIPGASGGVWNYPPMSLLNDSIGGKADRGDIKGNAATIEKTFDSFGISANVVEVNKGPAITQYAIEVALGTKLSKITALTNDLALALAAPTGQIRIEAPIPGRSLVGIEVPNHSPEIVTLKQLLNSEAIRESKSKLLVPLGLDVSGKPLAANIAKMPHVLIAGQTGSGKSVLMNSWIASLLFRTTPSEVRLILIDPKRVEFSQYVNIPHLLTPVIVEHDKIIAALKWASVEMENRYKQFAQAGARNLETFNEISGFQAMPYILIIIDELAEIIFSAPAEVEDTICRLAQMARATGIHLIIATQRPSVNVLTGLIKANVPCRISFAVASMVDSRVILDTPGAEKLLGRGDMLYIPPDQAKPNRIQGAYVSEQEVQKLIEFLNRTGVRPVYTEEVTEKGSSFSSREAGGGEEKDELFFEAIKEVCRFKRASASLLQRRFSIGYNRAAKILDQLEAAGVIGPSQGAKAREILIESSEEFLASRRAPQ